MKQVTIYVDGCCLNNPGVGGWGAVLQCNGVTKEFSGNIGDTTNNRAELTAVIEALRLLKEPCQVTLYSDSQITVNCASGSNKVHSNFDLWDEFHNVEAPHSVTYEWVKGHAGQSGNERAHTLAEAAARRMSVNHEWSKS